MKRTNSSNKNDISFFHEILRKLTHLGALVFPLSYYFSGASKGTFLKIMVPIALLMVVIDITRLRDRGIWRNFFKPIVGPIVRTHELTGDFTGATYILLSFCITIALYSKPIAIAAIAFIIMGDALAALIGRKYGRHVFYQNKTIEGSLGCLLGTVIVAILVPDLHLAVALSGAVVAVIFEAFSFGLDDNVTVPLLSGLFMTLINKLLLFSELI